MCMRLGLITDVLYGQYDAPIQRDQYYELYTLIFIYFQVSTHLQDPYELEYKIGT